VADLACRDPFSPVCAVHIRNHLALPLALAGTFPPRPDLPLPIDTVNGGVLGRRSDLSLALAAAMGDAPVGGNLIVNMSVGWDAAVGESDHPCGGCTDAVRLTLERAWCAGAILIAAAGNGSRQGALFPAAWEDRRMDRGVCADEGFPIDPALVIAPVAYQPLVYAVGALDTNDTALMTTRPHGGTPRLMAHGLDVVTDDRRGPQVETPTLTGTSMATAVVSGVAALKWELTPALSGPAVMEAVRALSVPLGRPADLCIGGNSLPCDPSLATGRVTACKMLVGVAPPAVPCTTLPGSGASLPPPDLTGGPPQVASPVFVNDEPWVASQPIPTNCVGCELSTSAGVTLKGTLPTAINLSQSPLLEINTGFGWTEAHWVTTPDFSFSMPSLGVPHSASIRFTAWVGFWAVMPEESIAVLH
jgi:hypothetical protein